MVHVPPNYRGRLRADLYITVFRSVHEDALDRKFVFFTDKACFRLNGYISAQNKHWSSINQRQTCPFMIRRLVCECAWPAF
jgi:hypothetical protein